MSTHRQGLRLALLNPIDPSEPIAERELALRMATSVANLGWDGAIVSRSAEIDAMNPDAVLCLHPQITPKLTAHPWLACYWNPPALLKAGSDLARIHGQAFELTYDAYLVSGSTLEAHLAHLMQPLRRNPPTLPFHVSSPKSNLAPNLGSQSRLFYVGSNWDGRRYPMLLRQLSEAGVLALHGTQERWSHLLESYQGPLPFDGQSVIRAAHHWGMGLCLHLPHHRTDGVPNMRVFELAAAGAVIITDHHPFIRKWFGDTVLYIDLSEGEEEAATQILERISWVRAHPDQARSMAAAAQEIFNRHLCLEALLSPLPDLLDQLKRRPTVAGRTAVLLPEGEDLGERLTQLQAQAQDGLSITALVPAGTIPCTPPDAVALRELPDPVSIETLLSVLAEDETLAILPPNVEWYPGHLAELTAASQHTGAVLAPGLWRRGTKAPLLLTDPAEEWSMPSPDHAPVLDGRRLERAWLRAAGLGCKPARLRGLSVGGEDWISLALDLAPTLAVEGGLEQSAIPSLRLINSLARDNRREHKLRPWPLAALVEAKDGPPRFAGLSDLNPEMAAAIPFLWRPDDIHHLPLAGPIWLYGAGLGGELLHGWLPDPARARLRGFLDSRRQGTFLDLPLVRPQDIDPGEMAAATIIITSQYVSDILRVLQQGAVTPAHIINAYPYIAAQQEEVLQRQKSEQNEAEPQS